ncbi:competence protein ComK [Fictibacillus iocasae]|uniref:Competence protein ComK n=1 Tax=Fictibacillus iocasae TaxID=2715437 RepID=A0ABW2NLR2_9BACL
MEVTSILKSYEIHSSTMALLPFQSEGGKTMTEVMEEERTLFVEMSPIRIIIESCLFFGSTYEGQRDAVRQSMGYSSLAPIMINGQLGIFFFPVESPKNMTCIWLSQSHVQRIEAKETELSRVVFRNGAHILIPQSRYSLEMKLFRTAQYRFILSERVSERMIKY